ncbi:hypothetical protein TNCV_561691 [Trichonephila clavipes]|uniref:Uncharacterized protein n=1 Tax=Trichonephila clavipes TaxID=2585209 RepID=A0A8X6S909_TRICX|nr:hypothetical protein TNCV_561691 [Trichonephila clavipes]
MDEKYNTLSCPFLTDDNSHFHLWSHCQYTSACHRVICTQITLGMPICCYRLFYVALHGDRFNGCQVIYSQFGLAIHQNDHQGRRRFVEWAQNEIAVVPDFHKQNCRIWSEANPQVYVEESLHLEKLTVWCALWAGGILLQKR